MTCYSGKTEIAGIIFKCKANYMIAVEDSVFVRKYSGQKILVFFHILHSV